MSDRAMDSQQVELSGLPRPLRKDVRLLGALLGRVIAQHRGQRFLERIEHIRELAKSARHGSSADWENLSRYLSQLPEDELIDIARAFNQFLNLANIADRRHAAHRLSWPKRMSPELMGRVKVELVLTAHPTEVLRRTLIQKYDGISALLESRPPQYKQDLERLIAEAWHTDEIRRQRPTPQDEAKWGFAVVENSLWHAVPITMRELDRCHEATIDPGVMPFSFASWMGGDRDGNPSVTAQVTREVLILARRKAADLFLNDVDPLIESLSMSACSLPLRELVGDVAEPYRAVLEGLRERLTATREWARSAGALGTPAPITEGELIRPLNICYESLIACGLRQIAEGPLLDTLRRAHCFGVHLVGIDVRQHADRHEAVFHELTRYLSHNKAERCYGAWPEAERRDWLLRRLEDRRPLFPHAWPASAESREVIDTCSVIGEFDGEGVSAYVVSMAAEPSDVLAVALLLKEAGLARTLPIVPLFETLADLEQAADTVDALLSIPWFRKYAGDCIQVMIGYSDSTKDAGQLAAAWAQYRAQEALVAVAARHGVALTLFHGRGGAIGRGGGPAAQAIESQAPGSVNGSLRVTEQGEMVRFKLGTPAIAKATLSRYLTATMNATANPPPAPSAAMRDLMGQLARDSLEAYRGWVRQRVAVSFFQALTPEAELAELALGSRPARRSAGSDIEGLRAIPWVFAWTQVRLMLPAWLGTESALAKLAANREAFGELRRWPFFASQVDMLEMVLAKADAGLARYYAHRLTNPEQQSMAERLCGRLDGLISGLLGLIGAPRLLDDAQDVRDSITVRNTYLDPLHLLQAELLARHRSGEASQAVNQALKVTMAGIASGLRNTG